MKVCILKPGADHILEFGLLMTFQMSVMPAISCIQLFTCEYHQVMIGDPNDVIATIHSCRVRQEGDPSALAGDALALARKRGRL